VDALVTGVEKLQAVVVFARGRHQRADPERRPLVELRLAWPEATIERGDEGACDLHGRVADDRCRALGREERRVALFRSRKLTARGERVGRLEGARGVVLGGSPSAVSTYLVL